MFGRKRIRELEAQLERALNDLVILDVPMGSVRSKITVERDKWYHVSYSVKWGGKKDRESVTLDQLSIIEFPETRWAPVNYNWTPGRPYLDDAFPGVD